MKSLAKFAAYCWRMFAELTGENDYDRYHTRSASSTGKLVTEEEYYLARLREKYSRINKCC